MIWRGLGILAGSAVLIVIGVVTVARVTVPDDPTFAEDLEEAEVNPDGSLDFEPTAMGGEIEVSGAAEGTATLESVGGGAGFGLGNNAARVFFVGEPLSISQMSYEGLAFFPEPEDCQFTEGAHNEDVGLVAVQVSCPQLVDIRGNGSISMEGIVVLPADLVLALDIPDIGGTLTVGDAEWQITPNALFVGSSFGGPEGSVPGFSLESNDGTSIWIGHDQESDMLFVATIFSGDEVVEIPLDACTVTSEELMVISPGAQVHEMTIDCTAVEVPGLGIAPIEGTVVYEKIGADLGGS